MKEISTTNSILILVNTLTKAEKRSFRLYSGLQNGEKAYFILFNLIESNISAEELYSKFTRIQPAERYEMAAKYLYNNLLDCLVRLREKEEIQTKIVNRITKAGILFEREMFDEAFSELSKAKKLATDYENDPLLLLIRRTELKYLNSLDFRGVAEKQLVNKQMKITEITKYSRTLNQHLQLYEILRHRLIHRGYSRSDKQKADLNDLVLSELHLIANNSYKGFEAEKLHQLFQATYYLNSGNFKSAIRQYQEIINLFNENEHLIQNPPVYYLSAIQGVLDSLQIMGLYNEMPFFLSKLEEITLAGHSKEFTLHVKSLLYLYKQNSFMQTGDFESSKRLKKDYEESLFKYLSFLRPEAQLKLHLSSVTLYMYLNDFNQAKKQMKIIMGSGKLFYTLPSYKTARLINLLLQIELKNFDFPENEIKSIKRNIGFEKQVYVTEKLLFKFISHHPLPSYEKSRHKLWQQYQGIIKDIKKDKYEQRLLRIFDVIAWIEHKLTHKPLPIILGEKKSHPI